MLAGQLVSWQPLGLPDGAKVLIEQNGFLGGAATAMSTGPISPFHFKNEQVIKGIPQEFMDAMVAAKGSTGHMKTLDSYGSGDSLGFFDREKYKLVAAKMLQEYGVKILYHSFISGVIKNGNVLSGLIVTSKSGKRNILLQLLLMLRVMVMWP